MPLRMLKFQNSTASNSVLFNKKFENFREPNPANRRCSRIMVVIFWKKIRGAFLPQIRLLDYLNERFIMRNYQAELIVFLQGFIHKLQFDENKKYINIALF